MELFEDTINILILIGFLYILWLWINTPIYIAKHRGITDGELTTIKILSWCGLLLLITWFIALILSLIWKPKKWITDKNLENQQPIFPDLKHLKNFIIYTILMY